MNIAFVQLNSLSEIDFDYIFDRSFDAVETNWPPDSSLTYEEKKTIFRDQISGGEGQPSFLLFKVIDADTSDLLAVGCGYITEDGIFDSRQSLTSKNAANSRNWVYSTEHKTARNDFFRGLGISKMKYNNVPVTSSLYRVLKLRSTAGNYHIIEETDSIPGRSDYKTILTDEHI